MKRIGLAGLCAAGILATIWLIKGQQNLEKTLTTIAMPSGLVWLGLIAAVFTSGATGRIHRVLLVFVLVTYTICGNGIVGTMLIGSLEDEYRASSGFDGPPFDLLVVLGGGAHFVSDDHSQLGFHGDRIATAARMYHRSRTRHLVATGAGFTRQGYELDAGARAAKQVWEDCGIPESAITLLPGQNTTEEAEAIRQLAAVRRASRIGLVSSAWHLPRATRLLSARGAEVVAVPCDFLSKGFVRSQLLPQQFIPNSMGFYKTSLAFKEYLASFARR